MSILDRPHKPHEKPQSIRVTGRTNNHCSLGIKSTSLNLNWKSELRKRLGVGRKGCYKYRVILGRYWSLEELEKTSQVHYVQNRIIFPYKPF